MSVVSVRAMFLAILTVPLIIACANGGSSQSADPSSTCFDLPEERVDSIRWSDDGTSLAVASFDVRSGDGVIRQVSWPAFKQVLIARGPAVLSLAGVTHGARGVNWVEMIDGRASLTRAAESSREERMPLPRPTYSLHEVDGEFLGVDNEGDRSGIVSVADNGELLPAFPTIGVVESFDALTDGSRVVYQSSEGPGTAITFVRRTQDGHKATVRAPGRLALNPTLGREPGVIYYENHESMTVEQIDVVSGDVGLALAEDASETAVSLNKVAYTFVDPRRLSTVCVSDLAGAT